MATNDRNEFRKAWSARTKGKWSKAKEAEATRTLNAPAGTYLAQLTRCVFGVDKNKNPYVTFRFVLSSDDPDIDGQVGSRNHFISEPKVKKYEDGKLAKTMDGKLEDLAKDFQRLGIETKDSKDFDEIIDAADKLTKDKPFIKIALQDRVDYKTGKVDPSKEPIVYINGLAREDEIPDDAEYEDDEEVEEDEEEEEEEEEEPAPRKKTSGGKGGKGGKKAPPAADDDEEEEEEESEEVEEDGETEDDAEEEEEPPEDYDEEEEAEEEEEEEEPAPKSKKKTVKKPAASKVSVGDKVTYKNGKYTVKSMANGKVVLITTTGKILRNVAVTDVK